MTMRDEYRVHREQYEPDHAASVKCCVCDEMGPEDEAIEFKGEWFDRYCAEKEGLRMCAWCGVWDEAKNLIRFCDDDYHQACADEQDMAHENAIRQMAHEDDVTKKEAR